MEPTDFAAWAAQMKDKRRWSDREIARQLGCGVNQVAAWRARQAPTYIALACAAISYGLPPWRDPRGSAWPMPDSLAELKQLGPGG